MHSIAMTSSVLYFHLCFDTTIHDVASYKCNLASAVLKNVYFSKSSIQQKISANIASTTTLLVLIYFQAFVCALMETSITSIKSFSVVGGLDRTGHAVNSCEQSSHAGTV